MTGPKMQPRTVGILMGKLRQRFSYWHDPLVLGLRFAKVVAVLSCAYAASTASGAQWSGFGIQIMARRGLR
jgi:hypothetical protein